MTASSSACLKWGCHLEKDGSNKPGNLDWRRNSQYKGELLEKWPFRNTLCALLSCPSMSTKKAPRRTYKYSSLNNMAHFAMDWIGSIQSLLAHTLFFVISFSLPFFGVDLNKILLIVTTIVSLEAVYMAIFIQMALNQNSKSLDAVEEDIDEIQEDVEEIQKDVDEMEKDLDVIQEDVDGIEKDIDEIQKDVDEIEKDIPDDKATEGQNKIVLDKIESRLVRLLTQLEKMKDEIR